MDVESIGIAYWIILLLTGLIFGIVGFFIGRSQGNSPELESTVEDLRAANADLRDDLFNCQEQLEQQAGSPSQSEYHFNAVLAQSIFGRFITEDDLKVVEGIGPKIEGLFHNYNIKTWKDLSDVSVDKCYEVLESGGEKYRVHDPASWPMQAKMCYQGKWKELYRWQVEHKHGKL